jgi:hypothetical protein
MSSWYYRFGTVGSHHSLVVSFRVRQSPECWEYVHALKMMAKALPLPHWRPAWRILDLETWHGSRLGPQRATGGLSGSGLALLVCFSALFMTGVTKDERAWIVSGAQLICCINGNAVAAWRLCSANGPAVQASNSKPKCPLTMHQPYEGMKQWPICNWLLLYRMIVIW